jgi:hypothetical protein
VRFSSSSSPSFSPALQAGRAPYPWHSIDRYPVIIHLFPGKRREEKKSSGEKNLSGKMGYTAISRQSLIMDEKSQTR